MIPFVQSGVKKKKKKKKKRKERNKETASRNEEERKILQSPVDPVKKQSVSRETGHGRYNAG